MYMMQQARVFVRVVVAALVLLATNALFGMLAAGTIALAYTPTLNATVDKVWRKSQGKLAVGYKIMSPEMRWMKQFSELDIDASLREMTFPIKLSNDRNIHMTGEGGRKAHPSSINAVDATVQFVHAQGRFTATFLAKWASQADGGAGLIKKQLMWQGMTKVEAMGLHFSRMFYGASTGVMAVVDDAGGTLTSGAGPHTIPLKDAYGWTAIPGTTTAQKEYIGRLFEIGDRVALIDGSTLVTNAIGEVTDKDDTVPNIEVTWLSGSVDPDDGDYVVYANGANPTTIDHTGFNLHTHGLFDFNAAASLHGIATSANPNWAVAHSSSAGGRYTGEKWRKGLDEIRNFAGRDNAEVITLVSQGVRRDVKANYGSGVRYADPFDLEIDGDPKANGKRFRDSIHVPPGMSFQFLNGAIRKKTIHDDLTAPGWSDGFEAQDDNYWVFEIDWAGFTATEGRKQFAYETGLTEA